MALTMTLRTLSEVVILHLSGRLCFLEFELRNKITALLEDGYRDFILNMEDVSHIDSFGLGQLFSVRASVHNRGGQLVLLRPIERVRMVLQIKKLQMLFQIFQDEREAADYLLGALAISG